MDCAQVYTACKNKLDINFRDGGELNGWLYKDDRRVCRITVPKGRKEPSPKTLRKMASSLLLTLDEFGKLVGCTLSGPKAKDLIFSRVPDID